MSLGLPLRGSGANHAIVPGASALTGQVVRYSAAAGQQAVQLAWSARTIAIVLDVGLECEPLDADGCSTRRMLRLPVNGDAVST